MKKNSKLFSFLIPALVLTGFFAMHLIPAVLAQSGFAPPSVLPGENANIGGYGDACVGLANMIRTGDISLRQIPCFIKYFSQTLIAIAGSVSVIFVMIGGYRYTLSNEANEEAKKTITYALIGLAVSLLAWIMVDVVLQLATE
ncbi:pilin [Patescibacteria group bacterium]|nr:pilin [Patescibacteria group bacterium]MBU1015764.1 pilin [Patescibacteria group bacterium]MBU1685172.1 pilin [Patescibacteria group bacterium]MBU1938308.1 pilin [Patescibacteria group bacterium]